MYIYALFQLVVMKLSNSKLADRFFIFRRSCKSQLFFLNSVATCCLIRFTVKFFVSISNWLICYHLIWLLLVEERYRKMCYFETCSTSMCSVLILQTVYAVFTHRFLLTPLPPFFRNFFFCSFIIIDAWSLFQARIENTVIKINKLVECVAIMEIQMKDTGDYW